MEQHTHYYQLHQILKNHFDKPGSTTTIEDLGISISHFDFVSEDAASYLPGSDNLFCKEHKIHFKEEIINHESVLYKLGTSDFDILCNRNFKYHIIKENTETQANGIVIMFHGLNEKKWDKYLPWAYEIAKRTHKAVVLFPIAFHMDRAPGIWSMRNEMYEVTQQRCNSIENSECSYVNAAISTRMEANPQRLFWSGLQTYSDIIHLVLSVRKGQHLSIARNCSIDLFGYSIGSFLSVILMMANPRGIFSESRLFCFCGGMTIDRMYPISKYIMDARAAITMQKSFATLLTTNFVADYRLAHYQNSEHHHNESWFKAMLRYNHFQAEREQRLTELQDRIKALVLKQDKVAPPVEAVNTLKGDYRDLRTQVQIEDFSHPYSHINPFPLTAKYATETDRSFGVFVQSVTEFLNA